MKLQPYRNAEDFCLAYGCPRNKFSPFNLRNVSFHRFPKDKDLRDKWTLSLKLNVHPPTANSVICSNHFESDCFVSQIKLKDSRLRYFKSLKKDAVPSIPTINISLFVRQKSPSVLQRLDNCENDRPTKLAKLQISDIASQSGRFHRAPLVSDNQNSTNNLEMDAKRENYSRERDFSNAYKLCTDSTSNEQISEKDDDLQVLRVFESLAIKADRQKNIVFRSKSHLDSRRRIIPSMRAKTDRHVSTLDKTEDLEQHQRYKALLHENSASQNSGYKNDSSLDPVVGSYPAESSTALQVKKAEASLDEYSQFQAEYPSSRSAEIIAQNAKYTTEWILNLEEKRKKLYREEMMKAEKTQELTQHLHKHNEKFVKNIEKNQWDWRSAFEIFKIEDESRSFPTLTAEMEEEIRKALISHPEHEKLVSASKITITRKDVNTLRGLNWLNDEVINCFMDLIKDRSSNLNGKYPKVLTFNTFFYPNLCTRGNAFLKRWNRKTDIFAYDMILAPIHEGIHWCLVQIDFRSKRMLYFDSMGGKNLRCLELFLGYLIFESKERNVPFNPEDWRLEHAQGNPKQRNGSDCGVFACTYAEFLSRDAKFTFDQADMPFMRRKMVYELLHGLLPV